jgi:hypothetical protein
MRHEFTPQELYDLVLAEPLSKLGPRLGDMKGQSPLLRQPLKRQSRSVGRPYTRRMMERLTHQWGERAQVPNCLPHRRPTLILQVLRPPVHGDGHGALCA